MDQNASKYKDKLRLQLFSKVNLPLLFWLAMVSFALFLWAINSYVIYQNQSRVAQSAELSVQSFSTFVTDYVEKHKIMVKTFTYYHLERIVQLANGKSYPYDLDLMKAEIDGLFPSGTEFLILDRHGEIVIGNETGRISQQCQREVKQDMLNLPVSSISIKANNSETLKAHYEILYSINFADDYAGLWVKIPFEKLGEYINNFNSNEYTLTLSEQIPPYRTMLGSHQFERPDAMSFSFIDERAQEQRLGQKVVLAFAATPDLPWLVSAIQQDQFINEFKFKVNLATAVLFFATFILVATLILMTRQFQRERDKAKQDAAHDDLFNAGPTVLLEKSTERDMLIRYASPNSKTIFNLDSASLIDQSYSELILPDDIEMVREKLLNAYIRHEDKVEMVYRVRSSNNGGYIWIYDFTHISYNAVRQPDILRGYITSIHDQKVAEKNAKDLIQSIPEAIFVTELDGTIVNTNQVAQTLFGVQRSELGQVNFVGCLEPKSKATYERIKRRYLDGGVQSGLNLGNLNTLRMLSADGSEMSVEISFKQIELSGDHLLIQVVHDVTMQIRAQKQLSQAKKQAEALAKARSRFVATMSHEIRTPMNGVLGMTDLLLETKMNSAQNRYLNAIKNSGNTLLQLINEVLDFAKLDEGRVGLTEGVFDLKNLVDESIYSLSSKTLDKALTVSTDYDADTPNLFWGDEMRVQQIIMNLLSNAIKFTDKGFIRVAVKALESDSLHGKGIRLEVEDSGIGIEEQNQVHLFDSFTQASDETAKNFGGTGLGLAICKQLVELMQGDIGVQSEVGKGSLFWVELPLEAAKQGDIKKVVKLTTSPVASKTNPVQSVTGKRVLVVEDDSVNQSVIEEFLLRLGARVDLAENGLQAIDFWRMNPSKYDLILMDCQMPVMDGFETTHIIRQEESLMYASPKTPIVALTANVVEEDKERCFAAGMDDYMVKPINRELFGEMVAKWMS